MSVATPLAPRSGYERIRTYVPGDAAACAIDLSDNTNRWGVSPAAAAVLRAHDPRDVTRYPSPYADGLKAAIGARFGISADTIVTGAGSDGVLEPAIRAFGSPGDRMTFADPTFVMAGTFAMMNGLVPQPIALLGDYGIDADAFVAADARITYLCSPNNPTGTAIPRATIERIVAGTTGLVIVDEAYAEFAGASAIDLAVSSDRVLVLRTFSKAYGLAGLRVGYGIGAPALVAAVAKARGPYTVGLVSELAAIAAIADDSGWVERCAAAAVESRTRLTDALRAMGLAPAPSAANFVYVPVPNAVRIADAVARSGIRIRAFGDALRITVAPAEMLDEALAALRAAIAAEEAA